MQTGVLTADRIERQLEALRQQEHDALSALVGTPEESATHAQLVRLLMRIELDCERLSVALQRVRESGGRLLNWTELAQSPTESSVPQPSPKHN